MRKLFSENALLTLLLALLLLGAFFILLQYNKLDIHLFINTMVNKSEWLNVFFRYFTHIGDGFGVAVLSLLLLFINIRLSLASFISFSIASIISTILKYSFFKDFNRPSFVFEWEHTHSLQLVEGVKMNIHHSFPSGHTTAAFAAYIVLALYLKPTWAKLLCLIVACLVGFSRMYLSQHFLMDVTAGAAIGSLMAFIIAHFFFNKDGEGVLVKWNRRLL
jgi:membrane-associated phospholipid phosphatase